MNKKEIEKRYNVLLEDVKTKDFYKVDLSNRVNCYKCTSCEHITKTKDVDAGVTPMMFNCEACGGNAMSTFYKDVAPTKKHTIEWYRPTLSQLFKMDSAMIEHVLMGGLDDRKATPENFLPNNQIR